MKVNRCDPEFWKNNDLGHVLHLQQSHGVLMEHLAKLPIDQIGMFHTALIQKSGLDARLDAGYCIDEWFLWQRGWCRTYAMALIMARPSLRLGVAGYEEHGEYAPGWWPQHFFAHDDEFAYDSAGRHPLPYHGVDGDFDHVELDTDPEAWGDVFAEEGTDYVNFVEAVRHSVRNGILIGWYQLGGVETSGTTAA